MKGILIRLLIGIACLGASGGLLELSENITSEEEINKYEEFCKNSIEGEGLLNEAYKEAITKIKMVEIKTYTYTYSFYIGDTEYQVEYVTNLNDDPELVKKIWYNANNPEENSTTNPCEDLKKLKEKTNFGNKNLFFYGGIIIGLIGLGVTWGSIRAMIGLGLKKLSKK